MKRMTRGSSQSHASQSHGELRKSAGQKARKSSDRETRSHRGGEGGPRQNAGGPQHRGLDEYEDRNP